MFTLAAAVLTCILFVLAGPAFAADGSALYEASCAGCHGKDGSADTPVAKAMKVPALGGASSAETIVKHVRESPRHSAVAGRLSDAELEAIAQAVIGLGSN